MEKQTVFIKRYPSKGELPKKDGRYITNKGLTTMYKLNEGWGKRTSMGGWQSLRIEYWLEEIELPSEQDVNLEVDKASSADESNEYNAGLDIGYHRCYEFILNKLKGETK